MASTNEMNTKCQFGPLRFIWSISKRSVVSQNTAVMICQWLFSKLKYLQEKFNYELPFNEQQTRLALDNVIYGIDLS